MPSLLDCLSDCQPKVRSDLMSFLNITSNKLAQEMALLREAGLNIQEENEIYQLMPEMPLLNPQAISTALFLYTSTKMSIAASPPHSLGAWCNARTFGC